MSDVSSIVPGLDNKKRVVEVHGLNPGCGYRFRVYSTNSFGVGPRSRQSGKIPIKSWAFQHTFYWNFLYRDFDKRPHLWSFRRLYHTIWTSNPPTHSRGRRVRECGWFNHYLDGTVLCWLFIHIHQFFLSFLELTDQRFAKDKLQIREKLLLQFYRY